MLEASREAPGTGANLRICIPPQPGFAPYVRERLSAFVRARGLAERAAADFFVAVGEALANAVEHARAEDPIEVTCTMIAGRQLVATVADRGIGFDAERVHFALPDVFADRGRGLPMMRRCADWISIASAPGRGTSVVLAHTLPEF